MADRIKTTILQQESPARSWFRLNRHPAILAYLIFVNIVLLCLLFPASSVIFFKEEAAFRETHLERLIQSVRHNLEHRGASLVRSMAMSAAQAMAGYEYTDLNNMVSRVVKNDPEIVYLLVMDVERRVLAHSEPGKVGSVLVGDVDKKVVSMFAEEFSGKLSGSGNRSAEQVYFLDRMVSNFDGLSPVMEAVAPIYSGSRLSGFLRCGFSLGPLEQEIEATRADWVVKTRNQKRHVATMVMLFFGVGVLVAAFFTRKLVRAINLLSQGVGRVADGDLEHEISPQGLLCGELVKLSLDVNTMTSRLKVSYQQLDEYSRSLEQKVATRTKQLEEAQERLMEQAHEAGMAEMAVGILHNIGNAITPAKIGISLMAAKLRENPLRKHLPEVMKKIGKALADPAALSGEEKERLLSIIKVVPAGLEEDFASLLTEVNRIRDKHEHIENIINLQMRYARLYGDPVEVDVNHLVEDALEMLQVALQKRAIQVIKQFSTLSLVHFEKTKLMQILVNLIKNSYQAMESIPQDRRKLTITTSLIEGPPGEVIVSLVDTGIGFTAEDKVRMFKFGYTTKIKGSGFGLHSCANYLIANNGSLVGHSEGPGKGAEFIVRLRVEGAKAGEAGSV